MLGFFAELGRFLVAVTQRSVQWAFYRKRNLAIGFGVLTFAVIVFSALTHTVGGNAPTHAGHTGTPTPTPTTQYSQVEATAEPADPSASQAPSDPADTGSGASGVSAPASPAVDTTSPESVARGVVTAYLSRPSTNWDGWERSVRSWTTEQLLDQMKTLVEGAADQQVLEDAPSTVTKVTVSDPAADADTNTPVRWSHTLTVTVKTKAGSSALIYGVVAQEGDDGWVVTTLTQLGAGGE